MIDPDGLAARYFAAMRASDREGLLVLFAPDATLSVPDGRTFEGIEAIGAWFTSLFGAVSPSPTCLAEIVGRGAIAVEIETKLADGVVRRTANFFDLNERGLIRALRSYARA